MSKIKSKSNKNNYKEKDAEFKKLNEEKSNSQQIEQLNQVENFEEMILLQKEEEK